MYISSNFLDQMSYAKVQYNINYKYIIFGSVFIFIFIYYSTNNEKKFSNQELVLIYESPNFQSIMNYNEDNTESNFA